MADEEKKPSFKLNDVALHKPSEKKSTGSHLVRETYLLISDK